MKSPQAFRSIGEVARLVGVATHVLRYWETQFPALAPVRRPDGRRYYRPDDLLLAAGLCEVMRADGLTIRGAQRLIALDKGAALRERGRLRLEAVADQKATEATGRRRAAPRTRPQRTKGQTTGAATGQGEAASLSATPAMQHPSDPVAGHHNGSEAMARAPLLPPLDLEEQTTGHDPVSAESAPADPGTDATAPQDYAAWLGRLTTTAAALRARAHPLPPDARPLHDALRRLQDDRS